MCEPLCMQRLRLGNLTNIHWRTFVNLRSFSFQYDSHEHNAELLTQICTLCSWIVNLEVSVLGVDPLTDEMVIPALRVVQKTPHF